MRTFLIALSAGLIAGGAAAPREQVRYLLEDPATNQWCIYDDWKTVNDDVEHVAAALPGDWGVYRAGTLKHRRGDLRAV